MGGVERDARGPAAGADLATACDQQLVDLAVGARRVHEPPIRIGDRRGRRDLGAALVGVDVGRRELPQHGAGARIEGERAAVRRRHDRHVARAALDRQRVQLDRR